MAAEIITSNTKSTTSPTPNNVSSLLPGDITNVVKQTSPSTFGPQIPKVAAGIIVAAAIQSPIVRLYKEKAELIIEDQTLDKEHIKTLEILEQKHTPKKTISGEFKSELTDEEYQEAVTTENSNYKTEKDLISQKRNKNQKDIDNYLKDPFTKQKEEKRKRKEARVTTKKQTKEEKQKAKKQKRDAVIKNAKKSLVPILSLLLTNKIAEVISQNDVIKKLVDDTNAIIEAANISNNPVQLNNAKIARDNALRVIQNNEAKILAIYDQIKRISIYITIFSVIVQILSSIPIPTAVPPGVGIPLTLITKIVQLLEKANRIVLSLSALLPVIMVSLQKAITILGNYKAQLLQVSGLIDANSALLPPSLLDLLNKDDKTDLGEYKGFKLYLREENNPKFVVRGNKRRYAVAVNKLGVEVAKSDYSFTLDPQDLVEQLKLIIDRQNLSADGSSQTPALGNDEDGILQEISNTQAEQDQIINEANEAQAAQAAAQKAVTEKRIPLTSSRRKYFARRSIFGPNKAERQKAREILRRGYE